MLRIIELLGLLAPIVAGALLLRYRRRSRAAFAWGITGCVLAAVASGVGLVGTRASLATTLGSGGGMNGVLDQMGAWAWLRFLFLVAAVAVLVIAALVDRPDGHRPTGWILGGVVLAVLAVAVRAVEVPATDREWLGIMIELLMEAVEAALLGLGVLLLAVAAVANRASADSRPEPTELARRAGMTAWRLYNDYRGSRYR